MTYDPGKLDQRIIVQRLSESTLYGEIVQSWATLTTVWAEILPRGSRESWRQQQAVGEMEYLVRIRRYSGLTTADRVSWGTKTLEIIGVHETEVGTSTFTELYCVEVRR